MIEIELVPRKPFRAFLKSTTRWACLVCHRRAGKTVACIQRLIKNTLEFDRKDGRFAYIAPTYTQAKDVAWAYLKQFTSGIPGVSVSESELSVTFHNGARIRLYGSDHYDRLRGLYLDGCIIDEAGDHDPRAWPEVIRPALADRKGWAVFIGTPKGKNSFYRTHQLSEVDESWYSLVLRASESGLLDDEELEDARKVLSEDQYMQEFECSFDAAIQGAYFASLIHTAKLEGRVSKVARDPLLQVRAYWDIGGTGSKADATSIWLVQFIGKEVRVLDYYEAQGQPLATHVEWLRSRGYPIPVCVLPHDGATHDKVHSVSYESALQDAGFEVLVIPNQGRGAAKQRIEAVRRLLPSIWFDDLPTAPGREALIAYHEKRDDARGIGLGPNHDWASHGADAFGLMAIAHEQHEASPRQIPKFKRRSII